MKSHREFTLRRLSLIIAALSMAGMCMAPAATAQQTPAPRWQITAIDARTGVVTAHLGEGVAFQFQVKNADLLKALKVGQIVYPNFQTKQVSLDGKIACCQIVNIIERRYPHEPYKPFVGKRPASRSPSGKAGGAPVGVGPQAPAPGGAQLGLPFGLGLDREVLRGFQQKAPTPGAAPAGQQASGQLVRGKVSAADVVRVHGLEGIQAAQGQLPEPARQWLLAHAKSLPPGAPVYIVNKQDASEWSKTHPAPKIADPRLWGFGNVPQPLQHAAGEASKGAQHATGPAPKGIDASSKPSNRSLTIGGVKTPIPSSTKELSDDAHHIGGEVSKLPGEASKGLQHFRGEAERQATEEWRHVYQEAGHDFQMAGELLEKCFEDQPFESPWIPIKYNGTPEFQLPLKSLTKRLTKKGSPVSSDIAGDVTIRVPLNLDLYVKAGVFIVPCLRYFNRPRNVAVYGTMTVGSAVVVDIKGPAKLSGNISFPAVPVQILPYTIILAGPVPIVLDAKLDLQPKLAINADASGEAKFTAGTEQDITLDFECDGHGCHPNHLPQRWARPTPSDPIVATPLQLTVVNGSLGASVTPSVTALFKLQAFGGLLTASLGPELYLTGGLNGCSGNVSGLKVNVTAGLNFQSEVESSLDVKVLGIENKEFGKRPVTHNRLWQDNNVFNEYFPCGRASTRKQ